jgi:hypothetical protein
MAKKKRTDKRGLFRVSWTEKRFSWRLKNGQENFSSLPLQSKNTLAATAGGAVKNIKKKNKLNWDLLDIVRVEQYDYDVKDWNTVRELKPNVQNYRDFPASSSFQIG